MSRALNRFELFNHGGPVLLDSSSKEFHSVQAHCLLDFDLKLTSQFPTHSSYNVSYSHSESRSHGFREGVLKGVFWRPPTEGKGSATIFEGVKRGLP